MLTATIDEKAKKITVVADLEDVESKSGKSMIVASSHGNQATTAVRNGKPVVVGLNCYTKK